MLMTRPRPNISTSVAWNWFFRESVEDGLYGFDNSGPVYFLDNLSPLSGLTPQGHRYIGSMGDLEIRWAPVQHVILAANFAGMTSSSYIRRISPGDALIYSNVGFTYRF